MQAAFFGTVASDSIMAQVSTALRFDSTKNHHVDHGAFWNVGDDYTTCYWDMLVRPTEASNAGYVISAGYGGSHNLLFGFDATATHCGVTGNMYIDGVLTSFATPQNIPLGSWNHVAIRWDLTNITIWVNGIAQANIAAAGTVRNASATTDTVLFVGGSDHSNYGFDLAWVRGFENQLPAVLAFAPSLKVQQNPRVSFNNSGTIVLASFCADYTQTAAVITDQSPGLLVGTTYVNHPGVLAQGTDAGDFLNPSITATYSDPADLPQWVRATIEQYTPDAPTVPAGRRIYDSFTRQNTPFWDNTPGLGSTEGGSLGVLAWTGDANYWISYGEVAVNGTNGAPAFVDNQSTDIDMRITYSGDNYAYFNYLNASNHLWVQNVNGDMYVYEKLAGVDTYTHVGAVATSGILRVVKSGTTVTVYIDGVLKATVTVTGTAGTKCGFTCSSHRLDRVSLFEVMA